MLSEPLILGILTFQVLYSLVQWYFFRRREYLYYAVYSVIMGIYFLLQYRVENRYLLIGHYRLHESVLNSTIIYLALVYYITFGRLFVDAGRILPHLNKTVKVVSNLMLAYLMTDLLWIIFADNLQLQRITHLIVSLCFFVFFVYVLYKVLKTGSVWGKFLVTGSFLMATGAVCGLVYRYLNPAPMPGELKGISFLQMGVILELVCLNVGLVYKSKQILDATTVTSQLISKQMLENEKQLSDLNAVRNEISHELKIELGDGLSGIKLMSDMVQQKMGNEVKELARISENSERLVQSMNEIVWSLNHLNDDLPGLISYIREYAVGFMDQVGLKCTLSEPDHIPDVNIPGDTRRHIFLAVKEALNNAVKHSASDHINIALEISEMLKITIQDNGKGMEPGTHSSMGNGLRNMKKRMGFLKGNIHILHENGVTIVFEIPLSPQK